MAGRSVQVFAGSIELTGKGELSEREDPVSESPGERRLDAEEVNRLASELDGMPFHAEPVDDDSGVGRVPSAGLDGGADSEHLRPDAAEFPPEPANLEEIGGSAEDQAALREEESR